MDKPNERLNMLQRNNQQLSAELARVREENQRLDRSVSELRSKQTDYADTLAAVDRVWRQLNEDVVYLIRRIKYGLLENRCLPYCLRRLRLCLTIYEILLRPVYF